jgi:hypothetical protein
MKINKKMNWIVRDSITGEVIPTSEVTIPTITSTVIIVGNQNRTNHLLYLRLSIQNQFMTIANLTYVHLLSFFTFLNR